MAVTLVGEVINQCDAVTGFNTGNLDTDIYIEPTGSVGAKVSGTTTEFYTTTLGATAPYNFSNAGGETGYHIIMWLNGLTPLNATTGMRIVVGNGTSRGQWYVPPPSGYTGGFISRVINTAKNFDVIAAGTWTVGGNPAQLTNVTQIGAVFTTTTTIMGNFNNCLVDQMTTGLGLRVDAGTIGTPNTFEAVRLQDESTSYWGWWTSAGGAIISKGKLYIGPATGSATSVFTSTSEVVFFAASSVAVGFYEIAVRGAGTDVTFDGCVIRAEDSSVARWSLTLDATTNSFSDTNSSFSGFNTITLQSVATLTGTTLIDGTSVIQNGATLSNLNIRESATADGTALILSDDPSLISSCTFEFSDGHAIEIDTAGTYSFSSNIFTGFGADGTNDAAIYNNSGGLVTLNISGGGSTPTIRNGVGASTVVNNTVSLSITNIQPSSEIRIYDASDTTTEFAGSENISGSLQSFSIINGGSGYTVNDVLTLSGGTFSTAAQITVTSVNSGAITAANITTAGSYTVTPDIPTTVTGGTGSGATINPLIVGTLTYDYNYTVDTPIIIVIFHLNFKDIRLTTVSLKSTQQSIPVSQIIDRVYLNP